MQTLAVDQIIESKVESLAFGGEGILRYQGFVVFVPFTAIGDYISCKIIEVKRSFAKGSLIEILVNSPQRIIPRCKYFGTCGGCQLQHMSDEAQNDYKLNSVKDAFKRIGHLDDIPINFIPSTMKWAYRRHITLQLKPDGNSFIIGFIGEDQTKFVSVDSCPIFISFDNTFLHELHSLIRKISNLNQETGRLTLLKSGSYIILSFVFTTDFKIQEEEFISLINSCEIIAGILIQTSKKKMSWGQIICEETINDLRFRFSPETFVQNHPEQSNKIYEWIVSKVSESKKAHDHILDLYCGFGITSLLLAKRGYQVTGMEYNQQAILFAKENALINRLSHVHFKQGDVEKLLPQWLKKNSSTFVIVNPPRKGLSKQVCFTLLKHRPLEIVYISCMPATIARDLILLCKEYEIQSCHVHDMFPQTAHMETCVHLRLRQTPQIG